MIWWSVRFVSVLCFSCLAVLLASPVTNPILNADNCSGEEFKCDEFCVPIHWKCDGIVDCTEGKDESDCGAGLTVSSSPTPTSTTSGLKGTEVIKVCSSTQYQCSDASCIPNGWRCDGEEDCLTGDDESNCSNGDSWIPSRSTRPTTTPWRGATTTRSTTNVPATTENTQRVCSSTQYQCSDASCIPNGWRCDGQRDCFAGEDERNCSNGDSWTPSVSTTKRTTTLWRKDIATTTTSSRSTSNFLTTNENTRRVCSSTQYQCLDASCIPHGWRCDGEADCLMGEDERNCSKGESSTPPVTTTKPTTPRWRGEIPTTTTSRSMSDAQTTTENSLTDFTEASSESPVTNSSSNNQASNCSFDQFQCNSGACLNSLWRCDFDEDCSEGEDEENCPLVPCPEGKFQCSNMRCILAGWVCDGTEDCHNGKDEENCPEPTCATNEFQCNDTNCIRSTWVCDGDNDCSDGEDEKDCPEPTCPSDEFLCDTDRCIYLSWLCDGDEDCIDGQDEKNCTEISTTTTSRSTSDVQTTMENSLTDDKIKIENESTYSQNCSSCSLEKDVWRISKSSKYFERFEKIQIWVNAFPRTWRGAQETCRKQNSTLVRFTNESQSAISEFLERKFGANAWIYWVEKPDSALSWYQSVPKRITIPSWLLNGREIEDAPVVSTSEECYFLDKNKVIKKALSCSDYAGFICQTSSISA